MEKQQEIILIIGATGNQGGAVLKHLLKKNSPHTSLRVLLRNTSTAFADKLKTKGLEVIQGSIENKEAMKKALVGVTRIFFHTVHNSFKGESWELEAQRGFAALDEIKNCTTLKQIIYSTLPTIEGYHEAIGKVKVEEKIRALGLPLTTVLAPFYLENFINIWPPIRKWFGLFGLFQWGWLPSLKELRMPHGSVQDFGAIVATILTLPSADYINRKITIISEDVKLSELLDKIGKGINAPIVWKPIPIKVFKNLPFPKEALDGLEFYANNLSDFDKVENAFLQTEGEGNTSIEKACIESHELYPEIMSIEGWAKKNSSKIKKRSFQSFMISLLIVWAKIKSLAKS